MAKVISRETMTVGIFAVLVGLAAAYGVRSYMMQEEELPPPEKPAPQVIKVLVAGTDLPADRVVRGTDITNLPMTAKQFGQRFKDVNPEQVIASTTAIVHRRLREPIKRMQPFLTTSFYLEGTGPSIAKKLQSGYRAVRVQVPDTREAGVQTGMYVDVMFRANARPAKSGQLAIPEKTLTLLRHIEVIDAERPVGTKAAAAKKALLFTLAVPEDKADMFGVIEGRGEVWLVPTPSKDKETVAADGTVPDASTLAELLGIKPPPKPPAPFETAIYRRGHVEINKFVDGKLLARHAIDRGARSMEQSMPADSLPAPPAPRQPAAPGPGESSAAPETEDMPAAPAAAPAKEE